MFKAVDPEYQNQKIATRYFPSAVYLLTEVGLRKMKEAGVDVEKNPPLHFGIADHIKLTTFDFECNSIIAGEIAYYSNGNTRYIACTPMGKNSFKMIEEVKLEFSNLKSHL